LARAKIDAGAGLIGVCGLPGGKKIRLGMGASLEQYECRYRWGSISLSAAAVSLFDRHDSRKRTIARMSMTPE